MTMTEEQRDRYRLDLLAQLQEASPYKMLVEALNVGMRRAQFRSSTVDDVLREASALQELGLLTIDASGTNAAVKRFRITEPGRVYLVENY
jgi:hypothetical protein